MFLANPTREMPSYGEDNLAYYLLAENVEDKFPEGAKTLGIIYLGVTRRLGLTKPESDYLVKRAIKEDYLIKL